MSSENHSHFIVPTKVYAAVYVALLVLTVITVWVAQFDFGSMNIVVALLVASIKATLVCSVFMGLYWDNGYNKLLVLVSIFFIALFIGLSAADVFARGSTDSREREVFNIQSPVKPLTEGSHHGHGAKDAHSKPAAGKH